MRIHLNGVSYSYPQSSSLALDDVSLKIDNGEFIGLIGPVGSGKSTILLTLVGLIRPQRGFVLIAGKPLPKKGGLLREHRRRVAMVFQFPESQIFESTAQKEVAFGLKNFDFPPDEIEARTGATLDMVGLPRANFDERSPYDMSGGERRRLALASILALEPKILLLDEPTAGLDAEGRQFLRNTLKEYHRRGGSVILVSHDLDFAAELCHRVVIMGGGKILYDGSREVFYDFFLMKKSRLRPPELAVAWDDLHQRGRVPAKKVYSLSEALTCINCAAS